MPSSFFGVLALKRSSQPQLASRGIHFKLSFLSSRSVNTTEGDSHEEKQESGRRGRESHDLHGLQSRGLLEKPDEVVDGDEDGQGENEKEGNVRCPLLNAYIDWFALDDLDEQKQEVTAVEDRKG